MANTWRDWFKRWWLWILLIGALALYACIRIFAWKSKDDGKKTIIQETRKQIEKVKEEREQEYKKIEKDMEKRVVELIEIREIPDKRERLEKLAAFANKRRR